MDLIQFRVMKIGLVMELVNKKYIGVDGEKNLRMDLKMLNIIRYFSPILLLFILVIIMLEQIIDNKILYLLSIILIIVYISLNIIIDKIKDMNILRFLNAIIIFISILLIVSGVPYLYYHYCLFFI